MKKLLLLISIVASTVTSTQTLQAQTAPAIQWDRTFGGSESDRLYFVEQTLDEGYFLGGYSESGISGDKSEASKGLHDYWILKTDGNGNKAWDKTIGGDGSDVLVSFQQTLDGSYILGGYSGSGIFGDKTQASKGSSDYWIVKLNSNGNKIWDKTIGGSNYEILNTIQKTSDGGYILGGSSSSGISGDKSEVNKGGPDYWIVKLDSSGNKLWDKTIGGSGADYLSILQQTSDGGYIVGGISVSAISGDKTESSKGSEDYWVVKLDGSGNKVWDKTIGGSDSDILRSLEQTTDGGYILGGISSSGLSGDKTEANKGFNGSNDYWVVKLDSNGDKTWDKTIGGNYSDYLHCIGQTPDGGYILGGTSGSGVSGDKTEAGKGIDDFWVVKLNGNGMKLWDKTLGSGGADIFYNLKQTSDGGFVIGGYSWSGIISGDKTEAGRGDNDYWIVKLGPEILGLPETLTTNLTLYPNPTTGLINLELKDQQPTQISVYNSLGQTILTTTEAQPNSDGKLQLDLSNQAKGIYTVQVISGNRSSVSKVVLQ